MAKEALILYIEPETRAALDQIAKEEDRSVSVVGRRLIEQALKAKEGKGGG